jgi:hypothetical protein
LDQTFPGAHAFLAGSTGLYSTKRRDRDHRTGSAGDDQKICCLRNAGRIIRLSLAPVCRTDAYIRSAKFTGGFDAVFEAQRIRIVQTPVQTPEANGMAERFVRTARADCLDWLLISQSLVKGPSPATGCPTN